MEKQRANLVGPPCPECGDIFWCDECGKCESCSSDQGGCDCIIFTPEEG